MLVQREQEGIPLVVRILHKISQLGVILCYVTLVCLVAYFPLVYMGEILIYPFWRWGPFVNRITIEGGLAYLFLIAVLCTVFQIFSNFLSYKLLGKRQGR